jgi:RimJ/RimL family protein N-acetyltransferase
MIPRLETERLLLRGYAESDLDALAAMQADPEVMRHLGATGAVRTRAETWTGMAVAMGQWALRGHSMWVWQERATGRIVGRGGILDLFGWPEPEFAYALVRDAWGQGFAQEAGRAVLPWGFSTLGRDRLVSFIKPANHASKRTAAALGGVFEGMGEVLGTPCEVWAYAPKPTAFA